MNGSENQGHYKTSGLGLLLVGLINGVVATYSIFSSSDNVFINYETMLTFSIVFIGVGAWMRTQEA